MRAPRQVGKTRKYGPLFGLLHPTIMDMKVSPVSSTAVMQIELCGGLHGLADLARGIQVPGQDCSSQYSLRSLLLSS